MLLNFAPAVIDSEGTTIRYFDNGVPRWAEDDYTTVAMFHGAMANSNVFQSLLPLAQRPESKLRLVLAHRRGYGGANPSTPHSDEQVENSHNGDEEFLKVQAQDVANFLIWVIGHLGVKPISEDGKTGGLVLFGYSIGSALTFSLLGHADVLSDDVYEKVKKYLRKVIVYDSPMFAFGYEMPDTPDAYAPFVDHSVAEPGPYGQAFRNWATYRHTHPDPRSSSISDLDITAKAGKPVERDDSLAGCFEPAVAFKIDFAFMPYPGAIQGMLRRQTNNALFGNASGKLAFPDVSVVYQCCLESPWVTIWSCRTMTREVQEKQQKGEPARKVDVIDIDGATHMYHEDEPEKYFEILQLSVE